MTVAEKKIKIMELMRKIFKNAGNEQDFEIHLNKSGTEEEKLHYCASQAETMSKKVLELTPRLKSQYKSSLIGDPVISSTESIKAFAERNVTQENKRLASEVLRLCKEVGLLESGQKRKSKKYEQGLKEKAAGWINSR